jgi:co-chaperonin GroES (HSP10)
MNSVYDFIVTPLGERYNNDIKVGDKSLVLNTSIEKFKFINKVAKVESIPLAYSTPIKVGDEIIIHHNVFRRFYNQQGKDVNSSKFFKEDSYFCQPDQIYLYKRDGKWNSFNERCFVAPVKETNIFSNKKEKELVGILKYSNKSLEALKIAPGDLIGFTPDSEFEFTIEGEKLYCMKSNDIVIKYEYKGDEEKYNPSWAKSG